jgi:hypothetical protein
MVITKVAIVQSGSLVYNTPGTIEKLKALTTKAANEGAQMVLFPGKPIFFNAKIIELSLHSNIHIISRSIRWRISERVGFWREIGSKKPGREGGIQAIF